MAVPGCWHELGFMMMLVLEALRVNTCGKGTAVVSGHLNVEKGDGIALLLFTSELNVFMDGIEAFIKLSCRVSASGGNSSLWKFDSWGPKNL